jgi:2-alkyl-3-oxoalkanoate reductase
MKVLVTGASGFLGQVVVSEALCQGHHVRAIFRTPNSSLPWLDHPAVECYHLNLLTHDLGPALQGVDAVIHCAAAKRGDYATQYAHSVTATDCLLKAMTAQGLRRLIHISSFSVYDYSQIPAQSCLTETSPLETHPDRRDCYAQMKLLQEAQVRAFASQADPAGQAMGQVTVLRPGLIYGPGALWHALLGIKGGEKASNRLWVHVGTAAQLPLIHVENCAQAIVAALAETAIGQTLNLVEDHLPTQETYTQDLLARLPHSPRLITLPLSLLESLSHRFSQLNRLTHQRLKVPGILVPERLQARFKPLIYSNAQAKAVLQWQPNYTYPQTLDRSLNPPGYSANYTSPTVSPNKTSASSEGISWPAPSTEGSV